MFMDEAILSDGGFSQETMGMKGLDLMNIQV